MRIEITAVVKCVESTIGGYKDGKPYNCPWNKLYTMTGRRKLIDEWIKNWIIAPGFVDYEIIAVTVFDGSKKIEFSKI